MGRSGEKPSDRGGSRCKGPTGGKGLASSRNGRKPRAALGAHELGGRRKGNVRKVPQEALV